MQTFIVPLLLLCSLASVRGLDLPPQLTRTLSEKKLDKRAAGDGASILGMRRTPQAPPSANSYDCSQHDVVNKLVENDIARIWKDVKIDKATGAKIRQQCRRAGNILALANAAAPCWATSVVIDKGVPYLTTPLPYGDDFIMAGMFAGILLDILQTTITYPDLPNAEFVVYVGDQPLEHLEAKPAVGKVHIPQVAQFKLPTHSTLLAPTPHMRCMANPLDELQGDLWIGVFDHVPWEKRQEVALGRFTVFCPNNFMNEIPDFKGNNDKRPCGRESVLKSAAKHPELIDAVGLEGVAMTTKWVTLANHTQWKYIISTDGWAASTRLEKILLLGSTVLKEDSPWEAYYYGALQPGTHYEPFDAADEESLPNLVKALKADDKRAARVAQAGRDFAATHLKKPARMCYWRTLIRSLSDAFDYTPSCRGAKYCEPVAVALRKIAQRLTKDKVCNVVDQLKLMGVVVPTEPPAA